MNALAQSLINYIESHFRNALDRDSASAVRPILVGPPEAALSIIFGQLTNQGQHDLSVTVGGIARQIVVLLVDRNATTPGNGLSCSCHWDYAVNIRNSAPLVLILAARSSWDTRPESLANTTETLGGLKYDRDDTLYPHLVDTVANHLSIQPRLVKDFLRLVAGEASRLEPFTRDAMPWEVINSLLSVSPGNNPLNAACIAAGLPIMGTGIQTPTQTYQILTSLAKFVGSMGLRDGIDQLKSTNVAHNNGLSTALDDLYTHLAATAQSPTAFETAPSRYYRVDAQPPTWYSSLTATLISEMLAELNQGQPQERLSLTCTNGIPGLQPLPKGPFVVAHAPELRATSTAATAVNFFRKVDRLPEMSIPPSANDPMACIDTAPPQHRKPIKYRVEAINHRPGTVEVLVLDTFEALGLAFVRDAHENGIPTYTPRSNSWTQEIALSRGGVTELMIFHAARTSRVSVSRQGEQGTTVACQSGHHQVTFPIDVEDNDVFDITLFDAAGSEISKWAAKFTVRDTSDVTASRLEALIRQHRTGHVSVPRSSDTTLHRLELNSYLASSESWKPVIACWSDRVPTRVVIDWNSDRMIGDVRPAIDPRPSTNPPPALLTAREAIRTLLCPLNRTFAELSLDAAPIAPLVKTYLQEYSTWLAQSPSAATWFDTIGIYVAEANRQAGSYVATQEPVIALLSPMHPLRLAWHVVAQRQLSESLSKRCPVAGLLSALQCPDAGVIHLWDGNVPRPRAFFSLPCDDPHWAVLLNTTFLDRSQRGLAMRCLTELGLLVQTITGGFTSQQTQDSLSEVNRLLPARATLRVGIIGEAESSSECGEGVFRWSAEQHSQDTPNATGCLQIEVFDTRGASDPSPEQLADLSEMTGERVRWFNLASNANIPKLDLAIIDQLGARSPQASEGVTRSAVSSGCLFRVRLREDFQNAQAIVESRVCSTRIVGTDLPDLLTATAHQYEELAAAEASSHFRFTPNQEAVGSRLRQAIFLSVTSSQIDPACIVRGTVGQGGYLWDYELPAILGTGESNLGYYLVAQPTTAMYDAVEKAATLVASQAPHIPSLLEEVSRHGIPILKRLASGGSQSRGELGLLLATRLLQDAFRPNPTPARLPVWQGDCIHLVLPVDPYEELFDHLRKSLLPPTATAQRPDLVVVAINLNGNGPVSIKLTPIEVKYRAAGMAATDMRDALGQASNLGKLLESVLISPPPTDLWRTCSSALLAQFLDFGFRIYAANWLHKHPTSEWAAVHQSVMQDVLERTAHVIVNASGRLLVFNGPGTTTVADLDGDSRQDTVIVALDDSRVLLTGVGNLSPAADSSIRQMDFSFPGCGGGATTTTSPTATSVQQGASMILPQVIQQSSSPSVPISPTAVDAGSAPAPDASPITVPSSLPATSLSTSSGVSTRVPPEARQQVREAFEGFIGNEPAMVRLTNDLLRALIELPPHLAKNYLFTGLPSTGKTELARRMARALRLPFVKLDGRGVSSRDKLFEMINGELHAHGLAASQVGQQVGLPVLEYPPLIVFIDEVHLVPRALQEALLTMLEASDRTVVLGDHVARVNQATFLFATTRASDVDAAFVSRCDEIQLREYSENEVARILRWKVPHPEWPDTAYTTVARLGRCVPRVAIQLAEALETAILVSEENKELDAHLKDVQRAREIDNRGLTRMDFEYLSILERASGPIGEQNILNLMRTVDKDRILNDVEPFLVRLGFIKHGPRGRELTSEGKEYLLASRIRS